jgi:hypothetical protein
VLLAFPVLCQAADTKGGLTCGSCHRTEVASQPATAMAHALASSREGEILRSHPKLTFQQGPYSYSIERSGDQSIYRVTDGKDELRLPIGWGVGVGEPGQTYLIQRDGAWYESRVSYYKDINGLDLTVGARPDVPRSLEEAFGRELSTKGAIECFNCHSTHALAGDALHTEGLTPGVQCQRCHTDAAAHFAAFQKPQSAQSIPQKLGGLTSEETSDFCGQCHRSWAKIAVEGPHNITNVRFQPYRLANSRCYDSNDERIKCTTCHEPHSDLKRATVAYDAKCHACHAQDGKGKLCAVGKEGCAGCHMPKIRLKEAHRDFTDHWIRVVRQGQPYPAD